MIGMGKTLGKTVIAEGIDNEARGGHAQPLVRLYSGNSPRPAHVAR